MACQVRSQTIVEMKFQRMKVSGVLTSPFEAGKANDMTDMTLPDESY